METMSPVKCFQQTMFPEYENPQVLTADLVWMELSSFPVWMSQSLTVLSAAPVTRWVVSQRGSRALRNSRMTSYSTILSSTLDVKKMYQPDSSLMSLKGAQPLPIERIPDVGMVILGRWKQQISFPVVFDLRYRTLVTVHHKRPHFHSGRKVIKC